MLKNVKLAKKIQLINKGFTWFCPLVQSLYTPLKDSVGETEGKAMRKGQQKPF